MATFNLVSQVVATTLTSSSVYPDLSPDRYGHFAVTHSGARLSTSSDLAIALQGTLDGGTTWFDIETVRPGDADYVNNTTASWCRIVPLVQQVRASIVNGNSLTIKVWVTE